MKDFYQILEVSEDAGPEEIKKAYKRQALKYHPDKNVQYHANYYSEYINIITTVNNVLIDKQKRQIYDVYGLKEIIYYLENENFVKDYYRFWDFYEHRGGRQEQERFRKKNSNKQVQEEKEQKETKTREKQERDRRQEQELLRRMQEQEEQIRRVQEQEEKARKDKFANMMYKKYQYEQEQKKQKNNQKENHQQYYQFWGQRYCTKKQQQQEQEEIQKQEQWRQGEMQQEMLDQECGMYNQEEKSGQECGMYNQEEKYGEQCGEQQQQMRETTEGHGTRGEERKQQEENQEKNKKSSSQASRKQEQKKYNKNIDIRNVDQSTKEFIEIQKEKIGKQRKNGKIQIDIKEIQEKGELEYAEYIREICKECKGTNSKERRREYCECIKEEQRCGCQNGFKKLKRREICEACTGGITKNEQRIHVHLEKLIIK